MPPEPQRYLFLNEVADLAAKGDGVVRVGITGTRDLDAEGEDALANMVAAFVGYFKGTCHLELEFVTGGCVGTDAYVAWVAYDHGAKVHTILPPNHDLVDPEWRRWCSSWEQDEVSYRSRNKRIVQRAMCLFALANYPEDHPKSRRSGTWQTTRLCFEAMKPVCVRVQHEDEG